MQIIRVWVLSSLLAWLLFGAASAVAADVAKVNGASPTILIFGDSLSAGYGFDIADSWPSLLARRLEVAGYRYQVANASVSGETTAGGNARLAAELEKHKPAIVVLELGGNDGLRGLPLIVMEKNLEAMIRAAQKRDAKVVLVGMRLPPNYGAYARQFEQVYTKLARRTGATFVPFLLEGVGDRAELMQSDGIHPRAEAQAKLLENVWPTLRAELKK